MVELVSDGGGGGMVEVVVEEKGEELYSVFSTLFSPLPALPPIDPRPMSPVRLGGRGGGRGCRDRRGSSQHLMYVAAFFSVGGRAVHSAGASRPHTRSD